MLFTIALPEALPVKSTEWKLTRLQTFRYKSEMAKPSRKLGFTHASRKGPMIVCLDTSASMYGTPERISSTLISLIEETAEEFNAYIGKCKELSLYDTGLNAEYGDKLITLSTCEYSRNNGRFVVVARLVKE